GQDRSLGAPLCIVVVPRLRERARWRLCHPAPHLAQRQHHQLEDEVVSRVAWIATSRAPGCGPSADRIADIRGPTSGSRSSSNATIRFAWKGFGLRQRQALLGEVLSDRWRVEPVVDLQRAAGDVASSGERDDDVGVAEEVWPARVSVAG